MRNRTHRFAYAYTWFVLGLVLLLQGCVSTHMYESAGAGRESAIVSPPASEEISRVLIVGDMQFGTGENEQQPILKAELDTLGRYPALSRVSPYVRTGAVVSGNQDLVNLQPVDLNQQVTLVVLDPTWWARVSEIPYDTPAYQEEDIDDPLIELDDLLKQKRDQRVLILSYDDFRQSGQTVAGVQRMSGSRLRAVKEALGGILSHHPALTYVSEQDHGLEPFIAGAPGRGTQENYLSLHYFRDGSVWMKAWAPGEQGAAGRVVFQYRLNDLPAEQAGAEPRATVPQAAADYRGQTVTIAASPRYEAGPMHRFWYGEHYRAQWATPITVPVLDLDREAGGLTLLRKGGGMQTLSLQFKGADGKEYAVRSVDKDVLKSIPEYLRETIARDIVQDFTSAMNPYGNLVAARLADAAGIYHTNPRLVVVPDDPRLGVYREQFAGMLMLLEERPDGDMSDQPSFGRSKNVIGATKLYKDVTDDNDHRVDQRVHARARLLDMMIADWDRHEDQWRWASFEPADGQGKIYKSIPRDHDWAFHRFNGVIPSLVRYVETKFQSFREDYGEITGLTKRSLTQDRRFTSELTREDWREIADSLRMRLTDEKIDAAVRALPEPIYAQQGEWMARTLKTRRDKLVEVADKYYRLNSGAVDIVGSNKHERFEITRKDNDNTEVVVYKTTKEGEVERELYRRTLHRDETHEVRLYGLDGRDQFIIRGDVGRGILVHALGGEGHDTYIDSSRVSGMGKKALFYDGWTGGETVFQGSDAGRRHASKTVVNEYERNGFAYDKKLPLITLGSNQDEGFMLGVGLQSLQHGFRKYPYAHEYKLRASGTTGTKAVNVDFDALYVDVLNGWDLKLDVFGHSTNNLRNLYGLGNETGDPSTGTGRYRARIGQARVLPAFVRRLGDGVSFEVGPSFTLTRLRHSRNESRALPAGITASDFGDQATVGLLAGINLDGRDSFINPTSGYYWASDVELKQDLRGQSSTYTSVASSVSWYFSPLRSPQVTLAARVGGAHTFGTFPIYEASTLGGSENLRGFRSTRFAGRTSLYQNVELRTQLFRFSTYLAAGRFGVLGFLDNGRVWSDGERSSLWHQGYGGGLWQTLFDKLVLTQTVAASKEETLFSLGIGFQFE